jgi:hypothetical protein
LIFNIAYSSANYYNKPEFSGNYTQYREKHMESVAENLRVFGINTQPMGMSWGVLFTKPKV